jgi:hypothetical protein
LTEETLPVPVDDDLMTAEPLPLVQHEVVERMNGADGLEEIGRETYQLPEKPQNFGNRFRAGALWNGNAKERTKGTKNRITIQRLLMEEQLRDRLAINAPDLLEKAVLMALSGDAKIMGLLLDKLMASPKNDGDEGAKDQAISITITNQTAPVRDDMIRVVATQHPVIDAE